MSNYYYLLRLIPFYPFFCLINAQFKYGLIKRNRAKLMLIWGFKTILLEPFRLLDDLVTILLPAMKVEPIFIIGYYRSGTTYLQELLSADPKNYTMTLFHSVLPEVSLCFGYFFTSFFTIITNFFGVKNKFHYNIPFNWNFPGEEDVAINAMCGIVDYNKIYQYPSLYKEIIDGTLINRNNRDDNIFWNDYMFLIKKLAYLSKGRRLILKSPPNLVRVASLKRIFCNSKFIFIHRDPYDCIRSNRTIWELNKSFSFEKYEDSFIDEASLYQYLSMTTVFLKKHLPYMDVSIKFEDFILFEEKTIKHIYQKLDMHLEEEYLEEVNSKVEKSKRIVRKKYKKFVPKHILDSEELQSIRNKLGY